MAKLKYAFSLLWVVLLTTVLLFRTRQRQVDNDRKIVAAAEGGEEEHNVRTKWGIDDHVDDEEISANAGQASRQMTEGSSTRELNVYECGAQCQRDDQCDGSICFLCGNFDVLGNGQCYSPGTSNRFGNCVRDVDCGTNLFCDQISGECLPRGGGFRNGCIFSSDCGPDFFCDGNICVARRRGFRNSCARDIDCVSGICRGNICVVGTSNRLVNCVDDFDCGPNLFCDQLRGECLPLGGFRGGFSYCNRNAQCGGGFCDVRRRRCVRGGGFVNRIQPCNTIECFGGINDPICVRAGCGGGCIAGFCTGSQINEVGARRNVFCSGNNRQGTNQCVNRYGAGSRCINNRCVGGSRVGVRTCLDQPCRSNADCPDIDCPFCNAVPGRQGFCTVSTAFRGTTDRSMCSQLCNNIDAFCSGACSVCDFSYSNLDGTCIE